MNWFTSQANHSFTSTQSSSFITAHKTYTLPPTSSNDRCNLHLAPGGSRSNSLSPYLLPELFFANGNIFVPFSKFCQNWCFSFCRWMLFWPWGSCTISTYVFLRKSIPSHRNKEKKWIAVLTVPMATFSPAPNPFVSLGTRTRLFKSRLVLQPRLKVTRVLNFLVQKCFSLLMFCLVWNYLSSKVKDKLCKQKTSPSGYKTEIKILSNPGLA